MNSDRTDRELLPCPFCGGAAGAATRKATWNPTRCKVSCANPNCGAHYGFWHPEEWNRRSAAAALAEGGEHG